MNHADCHFKFQNESWIASHRRSEWRFSLFERSNLLLDWTVAYQNAKEMSQLFWFPLVVPATVKNVVCFWRSLRYHLARVSFQVVEVFEGCSRVGRLGKCHVLCLFIDDGEFPCELIRNIDDVWATYFGNCKFSNLTCFPNPYCPHPYWSPFRHLCIIIVLDGNLLSVIM